MKQVLISLILSVFLTTPAYAMTYKKFHKWIYIPGMVILVVGTGVLPVLAVGYLQHKNDKLKAEENNQSGH